MRKSSPCCSPTDHYKEASVAENYDEERFSGVAGRIFDRLEKRLIRKAFADLPIGSVVGDVPCGTGRLAETLLQAGFSVIGVDVSDAMLAVARRKLQRFGGRFLTCALDARELDKQCLSFDAALCARVLMHYPLSQQIEFVRCIASVTRLRVVVTQGIDTPYHRLRQSVKSLLFRRSPAAFPVTPSALKVLLSETGLREIRRYRVLPLISQSVVVVAEHVRHG